VGHRLLVSKPRLPPSVRSDVVPGMHIKRAGRAVDESLRPPSRLEVFWKGSASGGRTIQRERVPLFPGDEANVLRAKRSSDQRKERQPIVRRQSPAPRRCRLKSAIPG
jgi:hypothetical protein